MAEVMRLAYQLAVRNGL